MTDDELPLDPAHNNKLVERLRTAVVNCNLNHVPQAVRRVLDTGAWQRRWFVNIEWKFDTFAEFITASPVNGGMGWKPELVEGLLLKADDDEALVAWRKAMTGKPGAHHDNVIRKAAQGNTRAYTLVRLEEERPDLFDRVKKKELSANAAAIEAGWRKKPEPLNQLMNIACKLSAAERLAAIEYLTHLHRLHIHPDIALEQINCVVYDMLHGEPPTPALLKKLRR